MPGICPRCDKNVYFAEEVKGLGNVYHKLCFSCSACRKLLDSGSITEHDNKMYCSSCYRSPSLFLYHYVISTLEPVGTILKFTDIEY